MLCEKCGKNAATTYFRQTVNGKVTEYRLCDECAAQMSGTSLFDGINLGYFLGNMFQGSGNSRTSNPGADVVHCDGCGMTYGEIAKRGKVGCAKCYETFKDKLRPSLESIHGRTAHVGKAPKFFEEPSAVSPAEKAEDPVAKLKEELQQAIETQEFERAAQIRDELKKTEEGGN